MAKKGNEGTKPPSPPKDRRVFHIPPELRHEDYKPLVEDIKRSFRKLYR